MHSSKFLLAVAALAGAALSQKSDDEFCSAFFTSFVSIIEEEAPKTPEAILSFLSATQTATPTTTAPPLTTLDFGAHASELCSIAGVLPSSLLPVFQTYAESLVAFGYARSSEHFAYVTDCAPEEDVASSTSFLKDFFTATGNFCEETPAPGNTPSGTNSVPTPTATSSACRGSRPRRI
ncbi:hypothetical protein F5B22DRAFT_623504 [Xylaria bambusicola]|uniref:uncharacterized protein n=1 Tax=Xylaria bambusicola TaxID=326684 RepID=UPI00200783CD|nr:uncharacterized protein F5B22DRAFT_623504 [Xylaria bambusicola]KAI0506566.1 hypothetical protein F5B22DRAFT_623504 [Xylaria bambusicola]